MSKNWSAFYQNIRNARIKSRQTQFEFSEFLGVPYKTFQNIETERVTPNSITLGKICEALGVSAEDLFSDPNAGPDAQTLVSRMESALAEMRMQAADPFAFKQLRDKIGSLELELSKKDEEIRKLKEQVSRITAGKAPVKIHSTPEEIQAKPEFIEAMAKLTDPNFAAQFKTDAEHKAFIDSIMPKINYPTKSKKSAG